MADTFQEWRAGLESPIENAFSITPNDGADLAQTTRGLYVGSTGDVALVTVGGDSITLTNLVAGIIHPIRASRVNSTGTTAANIVGVY